jgi:hypothetical protein
LSPPARHDACLRSEKLSESGERERLARRHAEYYRGLFERAEIEWEARPTGEWLGDYGRQIDNLRAALDWAFSPVGDASIGVALAAAAVPLWMHLSLMEECCGRVEQALAAIAAGAGRDARREMQLHGALAQSLIETKGAVSEVGAAGTKALEIAESLGNAEYQLRSLWGLWSFHTSGGQHRVALPLAQRFHTLAATRPDPNDRLIGEQLIGASQHYLGDLRGARRQIEHVLAHYAAPAQRWQIIRFRVDWQVATRAYLARILWLQGLPDQAMRTAERSVADARATMTQSHWVSLSLWRHRSRCGSTIWPQRNITRKCCSTIRQNTRSRVGARKASATREYLPSSAAISAADYDCCAPVSTNQVRPGPSPRVFSFVMAEALGRARQIAEGLAAIEKAIVRSERSEERWATAELLRIKGELLLLQGAPGAAAAAADHFRQALDWAHRQEALSWELRTASSLARLWRDQHRVTEARALLGPVYARFTEGFATADLREAKSLLQELE